MKTERTSLGATFDTVVFLVTQNDETNRTEAMAYFPNTPSEIGGRYRRSYLESDGFAPCCEAFALLDCHPPKTAHDKSAVARVKKALEAEGYILTVLDSDKWYAEKMGRKTEIRDIVWEATNLTDTEALLNNNKTRKENKEKRETAAKVA